MSPATIEILEQSVINAQEGHKPFPEIVGDLLTAGVSRYHIDFLRAEKTFYLRNDESYVVSITMPDTEIAQDFDQPAMLAAIRASQTEGQKFPVFLERSCLAGCIGYVAYLDGRRVIYSGRNGEEHTELFPS